MPDDRALLIAIALRHLESALETAGGTVLLPAGGPGDLDMAAPGMPLFMLATEAGDAEVPAATWCATFLARAPYEPGSPWPVGLPSTWLEEHAAPPTSIPPPPTSERDPDEDPDGDEYEDEDDDEEDDDEDEDDALGPQTFLEVTQLQPLPRQSWLFTNELVRKQSRGGRTFRPRVPTIVVLPD